MKKKRDELMVYISGQMTGLPKTEYSERFMKAESVLKDRGYKTCNPARFCYCRWDWLYRLLGYRLCLCIDLWRLSRCDRIYLIPGWKESCGARVESFFAWTFGIKRLYQDERGEVDSLVHSA